MNTSINSSILKNRYVLAVQDLSNAAAFYRDVLGFSLQPVDDPGWMFVCKDNCVIMLGECKEALPAGDLGDHSYFAYLEVDDANAYHDHIRKNGGLILRSPENMPWNMREFAIKTPDGHRIMIGQPISQ